MVLGHSTCFPQAQGAARSPEPEKLSKVSRSARLTEPLLWVSEHPVHMEHEAGPSRAGLSQEIPDWMMADWTHGKPWAGRIL